MQLLDDDRLNWSSVVANCNMNRGRGLNGVNSYQDEVGIDLLEFLIARLDKAEESIRWLDLCCGEANALITASEIIQEKGIDRIHVEGIDLVDMFAAHKSYLFLHLKVMSLSDWTPTLKYDLITCIHGLHYIGDKLNLIEQSIGALKEGGLFLANLDLANLKFRNGSSMTPFLKKLFLQNNIHYHSRKKILSCEGAKELSFQATYIGADDKAGKNYTGQEVVDAYYELKR